MRWLSLLLGLLVALSAHAESVRELKDRGALSVTASLSPATPVVPGQRVVLGIEVATDSWFSGGTRIDLPEVPGLVILQNEQFASNSSERRGAATWVIQRWQLDLFPQRAGRFSIPAIPVFVQLGIGASGSLASQPLTLQVELPGAMADLSHWVAAPEFEVSQSFDRDPDTLAVGDALERELRFEAVDLMAMMLPAAEPAQLPGLRAYPGPPELSSRNNRGDLLASRRQTVSYIAEQPGHYQLPAQEFHWWNTASRQLQLVSLPPVNVTVVAAPGTAPGKAGGTRIGAGHGMLLAGLLLLAAAVFAARQPLSQVCRWLLSTLVNGIRRLDQALAAWRRPGLPPSLNPGSNAGE